MLHSFFIFTSIVVTWILLLILFMGTGFLVRRIFKLQLNKLHALCLSFWFGWVLVIGGLQIWHIFWRVDHWAILSFVMLGSIGLILYANELLRLLHSAFRNNIILMFLIIGLAYWCTNRSIGPMSFDTQLFQRWLLPGFSL